MAGQRTRIKAEAKAKADVDEFMAAVADGKPTRQRRQAPACTAAEIVAERDGKGLSWRQVAINLNLGSPSAARSAYTELTGKPHTSSVLAGGTRRTRHRSLSTSRRKVHAGLAWTDDTEQDEIEAKLNGEWIEAIGDPENKNYVPAHWSGSTILVVQKYKTIEWVEELRVHYCVEFTFGKDGKQPLQVTVIGGDEKAFRSFYVANIKEVR